MFNTPPPGVRTRRQYRELAVFSDVQSGLFATPKPEPGTMSLPPLPGNMSDTNRELKVPKPMECHDTCQADLDDLSTTFKKPKACSGSVSSKRSTASSIARRKQLELQAIEAKAKIQMEVIDKRLEVQLALEEAEKEDQRSVPDNDHISEPDPGDRVKEWLDQSQQNHSAPAAQIPSSNLEASIQLLADTLKDMSTKRPEQQDNRLIRRLGTPRELPVFKGDCIDWLHFKNAFNESTEVCEFTASENIWRLRKALQGEAKEAVADLLIGSTSPNQIMEALELRFGRSEQIIQTLTAQLRKLPPLPMDYQHDITNFAMKVNNCVATIRALDKMDYVRSPELSSAIISKLPGSLLGKWTDFAYYKTTAPKLVLLADFLKREATMISVVGTPQPRELRKPTTSLTETAEKRSNNNHNKSFNRSVLTTTTSTDSIPKCKFCKVSSHTLPDCRTFKRALRKDKWNFIKTHRLCYCCLLTRHDRGDRCSAPVCDIDNCGIAHHRLLHWTRPSPPQPVQPTSSDASPPEPQDRETSASEEATVAHTTVERPSSVAADKECRSTGDVMLKVVSVLLRGPKGVVKTHALLDDGASVSIMDSNLADSLGLTSSQASSIKFIDAFGLEVYHSDAPIVCAEISENNKNIFKDIKFRKVSNLNLPPQNLSVLNNINYDHLSELKGKICAERVVPRVLIGQDNYFFIAPLEIIHGNNRTPYATRCRLGWAIHGCSGHAISHAHVSNAHICCLSYTNEEHSMQISQLNELVKNSFDLDSVGISTVRRENMAHLRAIQILDNTSRCLGDRWEVGLPFKEDNFIMPDSYSNALSRQQTLLQKFRRDAVYADKYKQEINKLFNEGYAREITDNEPLTEHVWYLPHFGVTNPNKPGKLRLVYDAAAKVQGLCLNDFLLTGPDLYNSLLGIMFRFREHEVAFIGDIRDMFLRIKIRAEDQHVLRFLWQESADSPLKTCAMTSLIFGATCSPFIAQYIKNKNALKYEDLYPEATAIITNSHYMDDCLYSTKDPNIAIQLIKDITTIHKHGGFEIRNWASNNKSVVDSIPNEALAPTAVQFKLGATNTSERTLGLMWYPADDMFGFKISLQRISPEIASGSEPPTKAQMLSIIMSIYDIHGFLTPFLIKSKILFQDVHRSGIDWNCRIQPKEHSQWNQWLEQLREIDSLRIPRCYMNASAWTDCYSDSDLIPVPMQNNFNYENIVDVQLHAFSDASLKAFAAVIYWRFTRNDGKVLVCLAASKARVTPLRPVSVPRLELQGALIAARLAKSLQTEQKDFKPVKRYFWTDSSTVLQWIRSDPRDYKQYVAHRLGEIDELTTVPEWRYVPSKLNVADLATKTDSCSLEYDDVWFQGPTFLREPENCWPRDLKSARKLNEEADCELRSVNVTVTVTTTDWSLPNENNFSSWLRLCNATARILYFVRKCQRKDIQFDIHLMKEAETLLIKKCQRDSFASEISSLESKRQLSRDSRLLTLTPYLDEDGVLRVGGRVDRVTGISVDTTRPVIIDGRHKISQLIVEYYHRKALHGANELVVNELRQNYWILRLRPTVRGISARCLFCRYKRATPQPQRMADLPAARLQHNRRPFFATGLDFFGPMEVTVGRRRLKSYGLIFTCLTIRAIHIELTDDLTTDATIMALRRFIARRGTPSVLFSDNGTNLRGADIELKRCLAELNETKLQEDGAVRGIDWRFIPPGAPEMGGAWERMIRTVKTALKVSLKERAPRPQTLATLLAEVEGLVNSRPITHVSNDPMYPEALTPNHFLIGSSSTGPVFGKFDQIDLNLRKQWRISQRLADLFWNRWIKEYLPTLLPRQKWTGEERALCVGDYVILVEPSLERGMWRHGVVSSVHPGSDGRVRVVDVRTRTGMLRRPVTRVALLAPAENSAA